jgi:hypothetical protein
MVLNPILVEYYHGWKENLKGKFSWNNKTNGNRSRNSKNSLSEEDFKKLNNNQQQAKCINCLTLLVFSLILSTITLSAILLNAYGNIEEDICGPIQRLNNMRKLANGNNAWVIPEEKRLQIISQNDTHISIVMLCFSSVMDETGNTIPFRSKVLTI